MTLKDVRDGLSRMFAQDRSLEEREINHLLIEDTLGNIHYDYLLKDDDSELEDDDEEDESDDYEYEEDDDDEEESWLTDDDSDLEESY